MSHYENILVRLNQAGDVLNLKSDLLKKLSGFKLLWESDIEAKMDDGSLGSFKAVRVWHRSPHTDKPHKGGDRYDEGVTLDKMKSHAMEMSFKCWLASLEFGGAKGGVAINPGKHSSQELKNITEALVEERFERNIMGPFRDVTATDMGTNERIMHWMRQHYARRRRTLEDSCFMGVVTGKPVGYGYGGIPGRREATGYGLAEALKCYLKIKNFSVKDFNRVALIGFGNVGSFTARFLADSGFTIVAVCDINGGIYNKSGLEREALWKANFPTDLQGDKITSAEILTLKDIHVLVPAAAENVITKDNANNIHAPIILEGANGPTTPEADEIIIKNGIEVLPDILVNAEGVIVSFFEWSHNVNIFSDRRVPLARSGRVLDAKKVLEAGADIVRCSTREVIDYSGKYKVSLRLAAYIAAINRVAPLFRSKHFADA